MLSVRRRSAFQQRCVSACVVGETFASDCPRVLVFLAAIIVDTVIILRSDARKQILISAFEHLLNRQSFSACYAGRH